ncbi:hypothetical protein BU23DRAFT_502511 [Bimuria novae-zelandiae CBS 107.79]|uniref:Rhodopsin domain-containing protein n=1 Tax=Bimuria novae-zelandiae CBS 107.79 TaxID=1447943 RepID=A0A6A5VFW1_9PLEO|nr:hypothetical protein BU23DRAFT_502511 [Bimuria novae-zelandiae CBS 107.79]
MGLSFEDVIAEMLMNAPDPNEMLPVSNRPATLWGTTLPFLILTWVAVCLRFWVRLRIMREPGWDDALVLLAVLLNTAATVFVLIAIKYGLGQHFLYLRITQMEGYIEMFYFANAIYITNCAVIKLSLLVQYLRIFKAGTMRWICKTLFVIIAAWGVTYGFLAWFPCFPPQAYYKKNDYPNAHCYGFGFGNEKDFISLFESHTALNMAFDLTIFITPMVLFRNPKLRMKNIFAMTGIFILGGVVVMISIWRLFSIVDNRAATHPYIDFTWWSPISIILSCLEIDIAIMCASMPIFWPVIETSFAAIFVTHEVHITEQPRYSAGNLGLAYELEHGDAMRDRASIKSGSTSRESLVMTRELSGKQGEGDGTAVRVGERYRDPYLAAHVDPFRDGVVDSELGVRTGVTAKPKEKWVL